MNPITSLTVAVGASQHITCNVLDQFGNVMPGLQAVLVDTSDNSTFTPDSGMTDQGVVAGTSVGTDTIAATYGSLSLNLPVIVTQAPSVPTSLQFTSP